MKQPKTYGYITLGSKKSKQRKIKITEVIQTNLLDNRTITINKSEENTYLLCIKNLESTGRNPCATLHLTKESMIGLYALMSVYFQVSGINYNVELNKIIIGEQFKIQCSDNLM